MKETFPNTFWIPKIEDTYGQNKDVSRVLKNEWTRLSLIKTKSKLKIEKVSKHDLTLITSSYIYACIITDANFSVNCGGQEMRIADGTVYEVDNSSLGAASYYVTNTEKWAVSNVGLFSDSSNPAYLENNLKQVADTSTPELFQTSRVSPGSLRYYGLGLENGNYTVSLEFAETKFASRSTETWESLGRRVFDIYIQVRISKGLFYFYSSI